MNAAIVPFLTVNAECIFCLPLMVAYNCEAIKKSYHLKNHFFLFYAFLNLNNVIYFNIFKNILEIKNLMLNSG